MPQYKEAYLQQYLDDFKFVDPECRDGRIREINQRTKRCNRCQGFDLCKMHPHFWLYGQPVRLDENERLEEVELPEEEPMEEEADEEQVDTLPHDEPSAEALPHDGPTSADPLPHDEAPTGE